MAKSNQFVNVCGWSLLFREDVHDIRKAIARTLNPFLYHYL